MNASVQPRLSDFRGRFFYEYRPTAPAAAAGSNWWNVDISNVFAEEFTRQFERGRSMGGGYPPEKRRSGLNALELELQRAADHSAFDTAKAAIDCIWNQVANDRAAVPTTRRSQLRRHIEFAASIHDRADHVCGQRTPTSWIDAWVNASDAPQSENQRAEEGGGSFPQ